MEKFNEIACEMFNLSPKEIKDSLTPKDVPDWDSMNYLLFISSLEKHFNVSFTMDEVLNAQSLGDVRFVLKAKWIT
ncbi:acyl carrier protein [bacterium]|nr:MAG: acyl carrier protein [bacterium]